MLNNEHLNCKPSYSFLFMKFGHSGDLLRAAFHRPASSWLIVDARCLPPSSLPAFLPVTTDLVVLSLGFLVDLQDTYCHHCSDFIKLFLHGRHAVPTEYTILYSQACSLCKYPSFPLRCIWKLSLRARDRINLCFFDGAGKSFVS